MYIMLNISNNLLSFLNKILLIKLNQLLGIKLFILNQQLKTKFFILILIILPYIFLLSQDI